MTVVPFPTSEPSLEECRAYFAELASLPELDADALLTEPLDSIRRGGAFVVIDEEVSRRLLRVAAIAEATGGLGCRWTVQDAIDAIQALIGEPS